MIQLNPGGVIVYHTFTKGVEAFGKPKRPKFILQPGELKDLLPGFNVIEHRESVIEDGRPVQFIVAQKPPIQIQDQQTAIPAESFDPIEILPEEVSIGT